jgi:integrase
VTWICRERWRVSNPAPERATERSGNRSPESCRRDADDRLCPYTRTKCTTPYTYQTLFHRYILPVIERVSGLTHSKEAPIGWHTLRRSLATLLISNGENVKVTQSQLRHTTPKITLELYAQAVSTDQMKAHEKVALMLVPERLSEE